MGNPFKKPKAPPPPPPIKPPTVMPVADDTGVQLDKKRQLAGRAKKYGRASTVLSKDDNGNLGG